MTTDGTATMSLLDQRLDALDRALLGLVSRSERLSMVADIETRLREKSEGDSAEFEMLAALPEVGAASTTTRSRDSGAAVRKRSRLALSAGILGIVAVSLLLAFPFTYLAVAFTAEMIGEVPAISLIVANVLAVAGLGMLGGALSLAAVVHLSRSKKRKRGMGWAITGLCTSPLPALAGLLAMVFFVLPLTFEYANNATVSGNFEIASAPVSFSPPVDCSNGYCVPPPTFDAGPYANANAPPLPLPPPPVNVPYSPANTDVGNEGVGKTDHLVELKVKATEAAKNAQAAPVVRTETEVASKPAAATEAKPVNAATAPVSKPGPANEGAASKPE